jgi:hypothetical protein
MTNVKPGDPIQPALNAGDVKLLAGLHPNVGTLTIPNGRVVANEKGAILQRAYFNLVGAQNIRFPDGLELDGAGSRTAMVWDHAKGIQIDGMFFHNYGEGIYVKFAEDCWVRSAHFENVGGQASNTAIFGDEPRRCDFSNSLYRNCGEGIHFFFKLFQYGDKRTDKSIRNDVTIIGNKFDNVRRHPLEQQEGVRGLIIRGNWIGGWTSATKSIIGISAALGGDPSKPGPDAWEIEIDHNVIDGAGLSVTDPSQFMGIEVMGDTNNVHHNDINNMGQPITVTYNSKNTRIADNNVRGPAQCPRGWWRDSQGIIIADQPSSWNVPVIDTGNHWSSDPMPLVPPDPNTGGGGGGSTMQVTAAVDASDKGKVSVSWTPAGKQTVTRYATGDMSKPDKSLGAKDTPFVDTDFTDAQKQSTWKFVYDVAGAKSNEVQIGPSAVVTPPPGGDVHIVATNEFDIIGGVVKNQKPTTVKATAITPVA